MPVKHVLIVEDERPIREMIAFGLKRAGFEVREAEDCRAARAALADQRRSEEHTSELQSQSNLVCRLLLEKKKYNHTANTLLQPINSNSQPSAPPRDPLETKYHIRLQPHLPAIS